MSRHPVSSYLWAAMAVALALVPILSMLAFLLTTGENSIHDDAFIAAQFAALVAGGRLDPVTFLKVVYATGHILLFPLLVQLVVAVVADLNEYVVVTIGWLASVIRVILLFDLLTFRKSHPARWAVLPIVATLVFLPSQVALYEFGFASLQYFFSHTGFLLGLWALVRFPHSGKAVWTAVAAGVFAAWSSGIGPLCWPVFALTMATLGYRRPWQWLTLATAGVVTTAPYAYFLASPTYYNAGVKYAPDYFNPSQMLAQLGWAFFRVGGDQLASNDQLRLVGLSGVLLLVTGVVASAVVLRQRDGEISKRDLLPGFAFVVFGLATIYQITALRGGMGAHRSAQYLSVWIGLVALALELLGWGVSQWRRAPVADRGRIGLVILWAATTLTTTTAFILQATDFDDYVHFLQARTPASAACLREYRTAPTYCRDLVFLGEGHSFSRLQLFGALLEDGHLSVFGRSRRLTMQGDTVLGTVRGPLSSASTPTWIDGVDTAHHLPWSSYRRLNLLVPVPGTAEWAITLPANVVRADFVSAVTLAVGDSSPPAGLERTATITLRVDGRDEVEVFSSSLRTPHRGWLPISFSLSEYAGTTVSMHWSGHGDATSATPALVFRYPKIEVEVDGSAFPPHQQPIAPRNTEKGGLLPPRTNLDLCFDLGDQTQWEAGGLQPSEPGDEGGWSWQISSPSPTLTSVGEMAVEVGEFSHFLIRQRGAGGKGADCDLTFRFADGSTRTATVAFFNDPGMHSYTYDLRLLEAPAAPLVAIQVMLASAGFRVATGTVSVAEMCLVGRPEAAKQSPVLGD